MEIMKQKLFYGFIFSPLLIALVIGSFSNYQGQQSTENLATKTRDLKSSRIDPERLVFLLQYIGKDYGGAVENHRVINPLEYQEMLDFSSMAIEWYGELHPQEADNATVMGLQQLKEQINKKVDWGEIKSLSDQLIQEISNELNVIPYPHNNMDLVSGKKLYEAACAPCHGINGDGKGPSAAGLKPPPSNFTDPEFMNEVTPFQFFNAMTYGIGGTAMPSHQQALNEPERWNVAFYLMTLRKDFTPEKPTRDYGLSIKDLAITSNEKLVNRLKSQNHAILWADSEDTRLLRTIDYLRQHPPQMSAQEHLDFAERKLRKSLLLYENLNSEQALQHTIDAYLDGIEPLEPMIAQRDYSLVTRIEGEFGHYRAAIKSGLPVAQVAKQYQKLHRSLLEAHSTLDISSTQWGFVMLQSLTIILREGVEASLLLALMLAYLVSSGYHQLRKYIAVGAVSGILVGLVIWITTQLFFSISPFQQETMEGVASLLAAAVLFSVSFWIIHKVDIRKWKSFIRTKAEKALGTGSGFALAFAAFLAVFREAFETVLFYQVLWLKSSGAQSSVIFGFILGAVALVILVVFIFKLGLKLPLRPFFTATGILLGLLSIVFTGYGVRELQNIGLLTETMLRWNISVKWLDIYPTLEGLVLQSGILISFLLGWFSVFIEKFKLANKVELNAAAVD